MVLSRTMLYIAQNVDRKNELKLVDRIKLEKGDNLVYLGDFQSQNNDSTTTLSHFFLDICRKHHLELPEHWTILSHENQMICVQLCLGEINKQESGEFSTEMSSVIDMTKKINEDKLGLKNFEDDKEYNQLKNRYYEFLKTSNMVDFSDIFLRVKSCDTLQVKSVFDTNFLALGSKFSVVEKEMLRFISKEKSVVLVTSEESILSEEVSFSFNENSFESVIEMEFDNPRSLGSLTEQFMNDTFLSYIHLLVNTRSELALANVINIPERELDHKAFTDIKRMAKKKNMSMCQTAISYVMRKRLGGKSYAPDPDNPLANHIKGLGEFTDFIHKLQTVIEEESNSKNALIKLINYIRNAIKRCPGNSINSETIEKVTEKLKEMALKCLEKSESSLQTPNKKVSDGGSALGRQTVKAMRQMIDVYSCQPCKNKFIHFLTDAVASQRTPIRLPSVFSKFKSPDLTVDDVEEDDALPLAQRLMSQVQAKERKKPATMKRYQASYDWATPAMEVKLPCHEIGNEISSTQEQILVEKFKKSIVTCDNTTNSKKSVTTRNIPKESANDQENQPSQPVSVGGSEMKKQVEKEKPKSRKRKLDVEGKSPKKAKKSNAKKKNEKPPVTGQKRLTDFFRM